MATALLDRPFEDEFKPLVTDAFDRDPKWYTLRYAFLTQTVLLRMLDRIGVPYHHLTYSHREPGSKTPTVRSWFPGYLFLCFDLEQDRWQQINRMPGVVGFLGVKLPEPLEPGAMDDLLARLPGRFAKPAALSCVAPGRRIRVKAGPLANPPQEGVVISSDRDSARVAIMAFNRPLIVEVQFVHLEVIG